LTQQIKACIVIEKEKAFCKKVLAKEVYNNAKDETILVQGIIDLYGITNDNSIGIGMCVNKDSDHKNNILGMARLAAELLIKHDLTMDKLVRHYDASRKVCPEFMSSDDWKLWNGFYDLTSFIFNVLQGGGDILDIEMQISDNCEKFIETYLNSFYIDDSISSGENDFEESLRTVVENKEE